MIPLWDENPTKRFPWVTLLIIAVNVWVFFFWQVSQVGLEHSMKLAAFVPSTLNSNVVLGGRNLLISMFMHGGIMHLLGNMWFLWIFGNNIEDYCGKIRFLIFYLLCGVTATLSYAFFNLHSKVPLVGASGAISGVLGAYLVLYPGVRILTLVPLGLFSRTFRIPAWFFLIVWIGFQFLSQWIESQMRHHDVGGVAFLAHIGGFVAGIILIFIFRPARRR
jgi:membrane associated rhomboid family serine protease